MVIPHNISLFAALLACGIGCTPKFSDRFSAIDAPRVLAVKSTPAEVAPKDAVSYELLVVDDNGPATRPSVSWSYCSESKPTDELNDVASACFGENEQVTPFGTGSAPATKLPFNACAQFGPDLPRTQPGQPQGRPADADSTGGYYQPVILQVRTQGTEIPTLAETRITCGLAGATSEQAQDYRSLTHRNENPSLTAVTLPDMADAPLGTDDTAPTLLGPSAKVTFRASWPACPLEPTCNDGICSPGEATQDCPEDCTTPVGCGGSEPYAYLDPAQHALVNRHEAMRVSWFSTAGSFANDRTGQSEADFDQTSADNTWTAPKEPGPVFMWVVLRDDRGGIDWKSFRIDIQ